MLKSVPPLLCVIGPSGCGKTRLLEGVIPRLTAAGLRIGAIKHCGHVVQAEASKDSSRLALAGAEPSVAAAADSLQVLSLGGEQSLVDLAAAFCADCDLVLVEGYSRSVHDKIAFANSSRVESLEGTRLMIGDRADACPPDAGRVADWILEWHKGRTAWRLGLVGVVLTGGASRRMGSDKSELRLDGSRVLGRLCEILADRLGRVMIVGRRPSPEGLPLCAEWHPDDMPGLGPLGGIATALRVASSAASGWAVLALACDMPAVDGALLDLILAGRRTDAPATAFLNAACGRVEPMPAIYEASALATIRACLDGGGRSVGGWLVEAGAHAIPLPPEWMAKLANMNSPEDLVAFRGERREAR